MNTTCLKIKQSSEFQIYGSKWNEGLLYSDKTSLSLWEPPDSCFSNKEQDTVGRWSQSGEKKKGFVKGNKRVYAGQGILNCQNACKRSYRLLLCTKSVCVLVPICNTPHLPVTANTWRQKTSFSSLLPAT